MKTPPHAVLIWRFSSLGDIVLTAPAICALAQAWPQTRIIYATKAAFVPLVASHPAVDEVVACASQWRFLQLRTRLLRCGADAICDLHGKARGFALRTTLKAKRRAVWHKRSFCDDASMRFGHGRYRARMHIAARYHQAVEALVGRSLPRAPLRYWVAPQDQQAAQAVLRAKVSMAAGAKPLIGMSPGALWATKRWPLARFVALAKMLAAQGMQIVLTGSPNEAQAAGAIAAAVPSVVDLTGQLSLGVLGGVIAACDVFVANDSGPMHLARAQGVPTLAFFGSTDPKQFDATGHRLMFSQRDCAPCSFHGYDRCPRGHLKCLTDLEVAPAAAQVRALLGTKPAPFVLG